MKKVWMSILICVLLAMTAVYAEENAAEPMIDMSAYTDAELVTLLAQVQQEIVERKIEKTAHLPAGSYIGGRDIPCGRYILSGEGEEDDSGIVALVMRDENGETVSGELYEFVYTDECSFYIMVDEGEMLTLPFECSLTIYAGIVFE